MENENILAGSELSNYKKDIKPLNIIERSIIKKYRKPIWIKFIKAINEYQLIFDGDRIAIAISGGKDSLLMAKCFQELEKFHNFNFELEFICMDPGFTSESRAHLQDLCSYLEIPIKIFETEVFQVSKKLDQDKPCYMCARMRRGYLYSAAQELSCNKLALGHHYDDVIETILLNVLCSGNYKTMMPKLHSTNFSSMELIRPMYLINEEDIIRWMTNTGLQPLDCACSVASKENSGKRAQIKQLIKDLEPHFDNLRSSIFKSAENVDIGSIIAWKTDQGKENFLENYGKENNY